MVKELHENFITVTSVDQKCDGGMKPTKNVYKRKYLSDGKIVNLIDSPSAVKIQPNIQNIDSPSPPKSTTPK